MVVGGVVAAPHVGYWRISVSGESCPASAPHPWLWAPSASPVPCRVQCIQFPAFVLGAGQHHLLGFPFPFGSQSHSSNWGTGSFLCAPPAWWEDQNVDSNRLCEELARVHVPGHCLLAVRELQKQVSRIRFSAPGPPFLSPFRLSQQKLLFA